MPGITGFITHAPVDGNERLDRMVACMMHEPSYLSGKYCDNKTGVHVGWVCHSGSTSFRMPIWNKAKDACVIFSGEDFIDPAELQRLKAKGYEFEADSASYLIHLYEEMGTNFIGYLNGWFTGLIIDLRKKSVAMFNDRYGLSKVYYHENDKGFYFSSEAKSLLKILPELRQLDLKSLGETFSCGCVLQNRTLFKGISTLPGGSLWEFTQGGGLKKGKYFTPESWENQPVLPENEFYDKLKDTFTRILPKYLGGKQQLGMSLTGGLDGRMIMAWANRQPGDLPCYSFGSLYGDCTDVTLARRIAKLCKQSHDVIPVNRQFLAEFPSLAEKTIYVSDGTMEVIGSVELYVNKIASQIAPVRMTGNYGSEIVRGNVAFRPRVIQDDLLEDGFRPFVHSAADTYQDEARGQHRVSFIAFKQVPWHHYSRFSVEQSQLTLRSPYLDNELVALMYQASPEVLLSKEPSLRLIAEGNAGLARIPTDRGFLYQPVPLLTRCHNLFQEFTAKAEYAYDYGMPQWLAELDYRLSPLHLERLFLARHKFYHFRLWYRDELAPYVKEVLLDQRTKERSCYNGTKLEDMVNSHVKGNRNYTSEIHRALTVELIQRQLLDQV